ncbi:hypothetical protein [Ornithinibacillus californiensis]|uniref:hypothetical protein n=1 Tax=Ornithinibacillus californiensis TaxID=161536 RepID=UPI00064DA308|nr:hypothetical protein [Ornithinibacillus californiensis]
MSEFTFGFVVTNSEQNYQFVKETVNNALIKPLNDEWFVFIADADMYEVPTTILDLSTKCPVMNFQNAEDHNWGFTIFHNGKEVSAFDYSYELEESIIQKEIELRYPDMENYIEFVYIDPVGQQVASEIREGITETDTYKQAIMDQFNSLDISQFSLFNFSQDRIEEISNILNPTYVSGLKNPFELVEKFKVIANLEKMSWIRPDRREEFLEDLIL